MTTIQPVSIPSTTLLRRAGFTSPTTDQLRALVARRLNHPGIDGASLSGATRGIPGMPSIGDAREGLGEVSSLLDELKDHVNKLASGQSIAMDAQQAIDDLVTSIDDAAQKTGLGNVGGDGFSILDVARQVTNLSVYNVNLKPGEEQKVEIDVRASAQQAGLFMDIANGRLDLADASSSFTIEVGGRNGTKELTFSSGTSAEDIAKAINAFSKETGVDARLSGTGIRLESHATGSAELTSIRVIDDGGASDDAGHIYRFKADDMGAIDPDTYMTFDSPIAHSGTGITDKGQDAEVWVNGQKAAVYGSEVLASNDKFTALFYLDRLPTSMAEAGPDAQRLGTFTGFTIKANGQIASDGVDGSKPEATPGEPGGNPPTHVSGIDDVNLLPPNPPLPDYGSGPGPQVGETGQNDAVDASGATGVDIEPPAPTPSSGMPNQPPEIDRNGPRTGDPSQPGGGGRGDGGGGNSPVDDLKAAATGPSGIDPAGMQVAMSKLMDRIGVRTSALDLIERVGLDVVPASLSAAAGMAGSVGSGMEFGSALSIAQNIRQGMFGITDRMSDFAGGTTSAQVLRLLGADGLR